MVRFPVGKPKKSPDLRSLSTWYDRRKKNDSSSGVALRASKRFSLPVYVSGSYLRVVKMLKPALSEKVKGFCRYFCEMSSATASSSSAVYVLSVVIAYRGREIRRGGIREMLGLMWH